MKKIFDFGKIDYECKGEKTNLVTIEMEYSTHGEKKRFSVSGNVWNARRSDIVCGGQCLDTIAKYVKDPIFAEIYRLWKLYHLNDMHPECEHQTALGWRDLARKEVVLYHWRMTQEAKKKQDAAEKSAISALKRGEIFTPMAEQTFFASLSYFLTTPEETLSPEIAPFYEPKKSLFAGDHGHVEKKILGHLREDEHPEGILGKACPVCGYKYGHEWKYFPIPPEDETIIYRLMKE